MQKSFHSHSQKVESEKPPLAACEEKVKLLTGNFQSEMNYFEVSCHRGGGTGQDGSYRSVKLKEPWNNINLLQIRLASFLSWINLISLSPVQSWDFISIPNGSG